MSERDLRLPPALDCLSTFIDSHIECLAGSSSELRSIALYAAKHIFDWALETEKSSKPHLGTLLATLTEAAPPQTRSQTRRASTRKRSASPPQKRQRKIDTQETPLPSLIVEGMNVDQIWQQLDLRAARVCENLQTLLGEDEGKWEGTNLDGEESDGDESEDEGQDEGEGNTEEMDVDGEGESESEDDDENIWEELSDAEDEGSSTAEGVINLRDELSEDEEDDGPPSSMLDVICGQKSRSLGSCSQGHPDLDDGFFDLETFNAETNEVTAKKIYKRKLNFAADEGSGGESEIDLFGSVDDSVADGVGDGLAHTELYYNDFFEPPSQVRSKSTRPSRVRFHEHVSVKKIKAVGRGMPVSSMDDEEESDDEDSDSE